MIMNAVLNVLNTFLGIIIGLSLFFLLVYLLLPWVFKIFVSPHFNASYKYDPSDFKGEKIRKQPHQSNQPKIEINEETGAFEIDFGENRGLKNGFVKIFSRSIQYTNEKSLSRKIAPIILKNYKKEESNDVLGVF
jgi:hypothetical protein